jgi:hypothetical protein
MRSNSRLISSRLLMTPSILIVKEFMPGANAARARPDQSARCTAGWSASPRLLNFADDRPSGRSRSFVFSELREAVKSTVAGEN